MIKYFIEIVFIFIGLVVIIVSNVFIPESLVILVPIFNIVGALIAVIPPTWLVYSRYKTSKELEQQFIIFVKDLAESINSGMALPMALEHASKKDYGALSIYVGNLSAQVNWGIPFQKALSIFAKKTKSIPIKRAITTIIETYKVGGKVADTLKAVGKSLVTIDKIRKERSVSVHSQVITSYLIYFVFIFILVLLQSFLLPALLPQSGSLSLTGDSGVGASPSFTAASFLNFIVVQGFFAGLATGKMSEGTLIAGLKHSMLLITIGYTVFSIATEFQIELF